MPSIIIKHIRGDEIPVQWIKEFRQNPHQTFTVILRPEGEEDLKIAGEETSRKRRNRIFKMMEGTSGRESSAEWIERIKSARTISPLKTDFE